MVAIRPNILNRIVSAMGNLVPGGPMDRHAVWSLHHVHVAHCVSRNCGGADGNDVLAEDLWLRQQRCPNPSPNAFTFPNKKGGFMDSNNCRSTFKYSRRAQTLPHGNDNWRSHARFRRACRRRSTPSVPSFDPFLIWKGSRTGRAFSCASAYFTHGEHKRALAEVDAILALKEK